MNLIDQPIRIIPTGEKIRLSNSRFTFFEFGQRPCYTRAETPQDPEEIKKLLDRYGVKYNIQLSLF